MNQPRTEANGQIIKNDKNDSKKEKTKDAQMNAESLEQLLLMEKTQKEIARALPNGFPADRMLRIYLTALRTTRNLIRCTPDSFMSCLLQAGQMGLEPNTPLQQCFLIPRRNYKREDRERRKPIYECTLIIGYQGMLELSYRTDRIVDIAADVVYVGDHFEQRKGLRPILDHTPSGAADREANPNNITNAYAIAELKNGGKPWIALSRAQIDVRRARSSSGDDGPWVTDYPAMASKSAIRALWKFLPKNAEMALAEQLETAVDLGRSQRGVFDPKVHMTLENLGIRPLVDEPDDDLGQLPVPSADQPLSEQLQQGQAEHEPARKD